MQRREFLALAGLLLVSWGWRCARDTRWRGAQARGGEHGFFDGGSVSCGFARRCVQGRCAGVGCGTRGAA